MVSGKRNPARHSERLYSTELLAALEHQHYSGKNLNAESSWAAWWKLGQMCNVWCVSRSLFSGRGLGEFLEGRTGILAMPVLFVCRPERYDCNYFDERAIIILFRFNNRWHGGRLYL
jgi:hypothetical protein